VNLRRRRALAWLAGTLVAAGSGAAFAQPAAGCRADTAGPRVLLRVTLADLFDRELLRLVELGLVGRLSVKATVFRRRRLWFDARMVELERELSLAWSRQEGALTIQGQPVAQPNRLELPEMILSPSQASGDDLADSYVEVVARLEVITASSLGQVARWLVRGQRRAPGPAETSERAGATGPQAVPRVLVEYLAADLARTSAGRCPVRSRRAR
jgi:hypothetical protein